MKNRILIVLFMVLLNGCGGTSLTKLEKLEGYNNDSKYVGKEIVYSGRTERFDCYSFFSKKIEKSMMHEPSDPLTIKFISNDNLYFLALNKNPTYKYYYYVIPVNFIDDGKFRFLDFSLEKERAELLLSKVKSSKEISVELIDEIITSIPKKDKFNTEIQNDKIKESYLKKFGIVKTTVDVKPTNYDAEKKMWTEISLRSNTLKDNLENRGTSIGSNAFGVVAEYSSGKSNDWTVNWQANFSQSQEEARNTKTITIYGTIKNAEIHGHYKNATLDSPVELLMYNHKIELNVLLGVAMLKDGSSRILTPVSYSNYLPAKQY